MFFFGRNPGEIVAEAIRDQTHELLYKRVPRKVKPTKEEFDNYKKLIKKINKNPVLSDLQKAEITQKMFRDLFTTEVERKWAK